MVNRLPATQQAQRRARRLQRKKDAPDSENEEVTAGAIQQAITSPGERTLTPGVMQSLQHSHGNRFVQRLVNQSSSRRVQRTPRVPQIQRLAYSDKPSGWGDVTVTRSGEGVEGVYFVRKCDAMIVVKPSGDPGNVEYGNKVMEKLGYAVPLTKTYTKAEDEGQAIAGLLLANKDKGRDETEVERQVNGTSYFIVMSAVEGKSIQRLNDDEAEKFMLDEAALKRVGEMMAADAFIGQGDRFFSKVNLGNFFYAAGDAAGSVNTIDNDAAFGAVDSNRAGTDDRGSMGSRMIQVDMMLDAGERKGLGNTFLKAVRANFNAGNKAKALKALDDNKEAILGFLGDGMQSGLRRLADMFRGDMAVVRTDLAAMNTKYGAKDNRNVDSAKGLALYIVARVDGMDKATAKKKFIQYSNYRATRAKRWSGFKWTAKAFGTRGF